MSLLSENTVTVNITRAVDTKTAAGGLSTTYTAAARGSLPTELEARIMQPKAEERQKYAQEDVVLGEVLLFDQDPQVGNRDRITFGSSRILDVLHQRNVQEMDRLWIVDTFESDRGVK